MKTSIQILVLLILFSGLTQCTKNKADIVYDKNYKEQIKATRQELMLYMVRNRVPGTSIAVLKDEKLIYSEAIGLASKDLDVPARRSTKFRIGQLSELFTSFIYLRMVQDGILHPDSSIQFYMPDFPEKEYRIELNDLAYQISGFRIPLREEADWRALNVSLQKGLEQFKHDALESAPGESQTDNLFHYNLLGAVMEKATNKTFTQLLKTYVTDTLKLSNTLIDNPFVTIKGRSDFYDSNILAQTVNATTRDMRYRAPSQGLLSNAEDLVYFGNAVLNSGLLTEETKKTMFEPFEFYGKILSINANAWTLLSDREGRIIYGKNGMVTGGSSTILMYPQYNLVLAFISNVNTNINESPAYNVVQYFVPESEE